MRAKRGVPLISIGIDGCVAGFHLHIVPRTISIFCSSCHPRQILLPSQCICIWLKWVTNQPRRLLLSHWQSWCASATCGFPMIGNDKNTTTRMPDWILYSHIEYFLCRRHSWNYIICVYFVHVYVIRYHVHMMYLFFIIFCRLPRIEMKMSLNTMHVFVSVISRILWYWQFSIEQRKYAAFWFVRLCLLITKYTNVGRVACDAPYSRRELTTKKQTVEMNIEKKMQESNP